MGGKLPDEQINTDDTLTLLVGYFDEAEQSTDTARAEAELSRDYYDGKQLTAEERSTLAKRGQPPVIDNKIKDKVDTLLGMEIEVRTDPKAFPRNPNDQGSAEAATDAIRYVADNNQLKNIKSEVGNCYFVEGSGIASVTYNTSKKAIDIKQIMWDRWFYDPHSRKKNFGDAKYLGEAIWMDFDDAVRKYPENEEEFEGSLAQALSMFGETYNDKPISKWVDPKRKRVRVLEIYYRQEVWKRAVIARDAMLEKPAPSAYLDEDGIPVHPYVAQSAYVDREGLRYGVVRRYKDLQDEHNKRRSKLLHLASAKTTIADAGAVDDITQAKNQLHKPDGWITKNPGKELNVITNDAEINAQVLLLQQTDEMLTVTGPNAAVQGVSGRISGRAKQIDQQAGVVNLGTLFDGLRQWELNIYRKIWNCVQQFWTDEKWVRVRDDERNMKFVGLNHTMTQQEAYEQALEEGLDAPPPPNPNAPLLQSTGEPVITNEVSKLDVDIIIDQAPDIVTVQQEQFQALSDMAQAGMPIPPEVIIEASALRNKKQILETLRGDTPEAQAQKQKEAEMQQFMEEIQKRLAALEVEQKEADVDKTISETRENEAEADLKVVQAFQHGDDPATGNEA